MSCPHLAKQIGRGSNPQRVSLTLEEGTLLDPSQSQRDVTTSISQPDSGIPFSALGRRGLGCFGSHKSPASHAPLHILGIGKNRRLSRLASQGQGRAGPTKNGGEVTSSRSWKRGSMGRVVSTVRREERERWSFLPLGTSWQVPEAFKWKQLRPQQMA